MAAVASSTLGRTPGLGFMAAIADVWLWVGVAGWAATTALLLAAVLPSPLSRRG